MARPTLRLTLLGLVLLPTAAAGQSPDDVRAKLEANSAALRSYSWTIRTETTIKGETKNVKLEQARYDSDGQLQKTTIGGSQPAEQQASGGRGRRRGGGRVKAKAIEKVKAKKKKEIQGLIQVVQTYAKPAPEQLQDFLRRAAKEPGEDAAGSFLRLSGTGFNQPDDNVVIELDGQTSLPRRFQIESFYDGKPFSLAIEFKAIADGPSHPARVVVDYPDEKLQIKIENYDYEPAG